MQPLSLSLSLCVCVCVCVCGVVKGEIERERSFDRERHTNGCCFSPSAVLQAYGPQAHPTDVNVCVSARYRVTIVVLCCRHTHTHTLSPPQNTNIWTRSSHTRTNIDRSLELPLTILPHIDARQGRIVMVCVFFWVCGLMLCDA